MEKLISTKTSTSVLPSLICDHCGEKRYTTINLLGSERTVPCLCRCQCQALEAQKAEEKRQQQRKAVNKIKKYSLMDQRFAHCTLANWQDHIGPPGLKKTALKYISQWQEMKENNVGLLIHGGPGIGKSHASFTIANELIHRYRVVVVAVSAIGLLSRIKETYAHYGREAEVDILNSLNHAALLILDDLGAEQKTEWSTAMLYQIIDSRYRSGKPMIITTNLNLDQLRKKLTLGDGVDRTFDRIVEMCLPMEVTGTSNRTAVAHEKRQQLLTILKKGE